MIRVGIVGAGIGGLACARRLIDRGAEVTLFDKGSRPGGRMATRPFGGVEYDHGAQYFTARDPGFRRQVNEWIDEGCAAEWQATIVGLAGGVVKQTRTATRRYVGVPGMNAPAARLARGCDVRSRVRITAVDRGERGWVLRHDGADEGPFDKVVVNVPAPQAVPLLEAAPELQRQAAAVKMSGCWAAMVAFDTPIEVHFDGAFVNEGPLSWIARNGAKPGRRGESWVLHAGPEWTERHREDEPKSVAAGLLAAFADALAVRVSEPTTLHVHRWGFAVPEEPLPARCLVDAAGRIAACGDWCAGPRVEGAYLSGIAAADRILPPPRA